MDDFVRKNLQDLFKNASKLNAAAFPPRKFAVCDVQSKLVCDAKHVFFDMCMGGIDLLLLVPILVLNMSITAKNVKNTALL